MYVPDTMYGGKFLQLAMTEKDAFDNKYEPPEGWSTRSTGMSSIDRLLHGGNVGNLLTL